jgi:hypothetical protein
MQFIGYLLMGESLSGMEQDNLIFPVFQHFPSQIEGFAIRIGRESVAFEVVVVVLKLT